jgi:hypothetical protein
LNPKDGKLREESEIMADIEKEVEQEVVMEEGGEVEEEEEEEEEGERFSETEVGQVVQRGSCLFYVCEEDDTPAKIAASKGVDIGTLMDDNQSLGYLRKNSKLKRGTGLCISWAPGCGGELEVEEDDEEEDEEDEEEEDEEEEDEEEEDEEEEDEEEEPIQWDRLRKRRYMEERIKKNWPLAFHPDEDLSLDEMVREHKHWYTSRLKFKPNVHSGTLVDAITCCITNYILAAEEQGTNMSRESSVAERCARLVKLACLVDQYCTVHLDRGYGTVAAAEALAAVGTRCNINIPINRIGLPRVALDVVTEDLKARDGEGQRWCWCVFHKGDYELVVWSDSFPINFLTNRFSANRVGLLKRAVPGAIEIKMVEVPEAPWAYNVWGRSGTDGADQFRKNINCSGRRTLRDGVKGFMFTCDCCMTNGCSMKKTKNKKTTKISFVVEYIEYVFNQWTARKAKNASKRISTTASTHYRGAHELSEPRLDGASTGKKGRCWYCAEGQPTKTQCGADGRFKGGYKSLWSYCYCAECTKWYHPVCYFKIKAHKANSQ